MKEELINFLTQKIKFQKQGNSINTLFDKIHIMILPTNVFRKTDKCKTFMNVLKFAFFFNEKLFQKKAKLAVSKHSHLNL